MNIVDEMFNLFASKGGAAYFGEPVSQRDHALQAAHLASTEHAPDSLVVAALLHDIGHLLHQLREDIAEQGLDARHEVVGHSWLARYFGPEITEPVRLHVQAKRYLCGADSEYFNRLSAASIQSLALQGGSLDDAAMREFEKSAYYRDALRLRAWDDAAKVAGLSVPALEVYRAIVKSALRQEIDTGSGQRLAVFE